MKNEFKIDIARFYRDHNIPFVSDGHKHSTVGWTNTHCPFCPGKEGYHLGYNRADGYFVCWRCGFHPFVETIAELLKIKEREVYPRIRNYREKYFGDDTEKPGTLHVVNPVIKQSNVELPSSCGCLEHRHKQYLRKRGYDPTELELSWSICGAGPVSRLGRVSFANRIIIPICWDGRVVSFQARDISGLSDLRYIACPSDKEIIPHKHIVYRHQSPRYHDRVIVTEGIFDAWKFGDIAVATFGVKYTHYQVSLLSKMFSKIAIAYDNDEAGISQGKKLFSELSFAGKQVRMIHVATDPGDLSREEAAKIADDVARWDD